MKRVPRRSLGTRDPRANSPGGGTKKIPDPFAPNYGYLILLVNRAAMLGHDVRARRSQLPRQARNGERDYPPARRETSRRRVGRRATADRGSARQGQAHRPRTP